MGEAVKPSSQVDSSSQTNSAVLVVDGDVSTCFKSDEEVLPWWSVDLGSIKQISGVHLTGCEGVSSQVVSVVASTKTVRQTITSGQTITTEVLTGKGFSQIGTVTVVGGNTVQV